MVKVTTVYPEMCECGRLYKDRRDETGKMMCSACYNNCSVETLKKLWGEPTKPVLQEEYGSISPVEIWDATLHDSSGKQIEIPSCKRCGCLMLMMIGKEAFVWLCPEC